jgi:hypothetical protein
LLQLVPFVTWRKLLARWDQRHVEHSLRSVCVLSSAHRGRTVAAVETQTPAVRGEALVETQRAYGEHRPAQETDTPPIVRAAHIRRCRTAPAAAKGSRSQAADVRCRHSTSNHFVGPRECPRKRHQPRWGIRNRGHPYPHLQMGGSAPLISVQIDH